MTKKLADVTAELKANTEPALEDMTQEQINAYRDMLDIQRMEMDMLNANTFLALDVVRTLSPMLNDDSRLSATTPVSTELGKFQKDVVKKLTEAIKHIKFNEIEA
jgi:hypothetical protein